MKPVLYAMKFQGKAESAGDNTLRAATSTVANQITSTAGQSGLSTQMEQVAGEPAEFTSEVTMTGQTSLTEVGTINFGNGNSVTFSTVGEGYVSASPENGLSHGCIMWKVDSGTGQFEGASGLITSNFTLSDAGEVNDYHFGYLWVH